VPSRRTILGTLLGTLAGYLFTRRTTPGSEVPGQSSTPALPARPSKPGFDAVNGKLNLPSLPTGGDYYMVFARDVTKPSGDAVLLGTTIGPELDLKTTSLPRAKIIRFG
jgi:hypothetical protein